MNRRTLSLLVAALFTLSGCGARHPVEDAAPTGLSPATPSQQADPTTLLTDPAQLCDSGRGLTFRNSAGRHAADTHSARLAAAP